MSAEITLYDPTTADLQTFIDDPNTAVCNIYGEGWLTKEQQLGCIVLRHTVPKTINLYGRLCLVPQTYTGDTSLFYSGNAGFANLTINGGVLDGQWAEGASGGEQMHGYNLINAENVRINGQTLRNFRGDGIKLLGNGADPSIKTRYVWLTDLLTEANGRSGVTVQRQLEWLFITNCVHRNNKDQAIDFEPTGLTAKWKKPRLVFVNGGGIEHNNNTMAMTLSHGVDVTISNYYIYGSVHAVEPENLTMDNVQIHSNLPYEGQTGRLALQISEGAKNVNLNNVDMIQRSDFQVVEFTAQNREGANGVSWRGGSLTQPFAKDGVGLLTSENVDIEGVEFSGSGTRAAIKVYPTAGSVAYTRIANNRFDGWQHGVRVNTGSYTLGRLDVIGNCPQNVTTFYKLDSGGNVGRLDYERNE